MIRRSTVAAAALLLAGCAYSNALYNARRSYADAQRAAARGDRATATSALHATIDGAAVAYRADPGSTSAAEALLLIGRASFRLGEFDRAAAALRALLLREPRRGDVGAAYALLGAIDAGAGRNGAALARLDSAFTAGVAGLELGIAHLARARLRFGAGDTAAAWSDLRAAARHPPLRAEVALESASRAIALGDSTRARAGLHAMLASPSARPAADTLAALTGAAADRWGDAWVALSIAHASSGPPHAAASGSQPPLGDFAAATLLLQSATDTSALAPAADLLVAATHPTAGDLLEEIAGVRALIDFAEQRDQPLALFAAAEAAHVRLDAPGLARALFVAYAEHAPGEVWAAKALLAALALGADPMAIHERLAVYPHNPYVRAAAGSSDDAAFRAAEERLDRGLRGIHHDALVASHGSAAVPRDTLDAVPR